jgi:hypothetical protein
MTKQATASKQQPIPGLFGPRVNLAQLEAQAEVERQQQKAEAAQRRREQQQEEAEPRSLLDCWRLLALPRILKPEDIRIVRLGWGGWELRVFWKNEGFKGYVSGHPSTVGLKGPGFDEVEVYDLPKITEVLMKALKEGSTWGKAQWTADEKLWLAWFKEQNDLREAKSMNNAPILFPERRPWWKTLQAAGGLQLRLQLLTVLKTGPLPLGTLANPKALCRLIALQALQADGWVKEKRQLAIREAA